MRKKIIVSGIIFMLLLVVFVSPAAAEISWEEACGFYGGIWSGGSSNGTCTYPASSVWAFYACGEDQAHEITVVDNMSTGSKCIPLDVPAHEFETSPEAELDAWVSNCGVNLFSAPTAGIVTITRPRKYNVPQPAPNYGFICSIGFVNSEGKVLDKWNSVTNLYYNLDHITKGYYDQGILNFYTLQDGEWTTCNNMIYHPNEGSTDFGRVSCRSTGPTMFGLGTDLSKHSRALPPIS